MAGDSSNQSNSQKQKNSTVARSLTGLSQPFPDYRGLADNEQSIASAALQYVEHITNVVPNNNIVNRAIGEIKKFLEKIKDEQHLSINNFINTADNFVLHTFRYFNCWRLTKQKVKILPPSKTAKSS